MDYYVLRCIKSCANPWDPLRAFHVGDYVGDAGIAVQKIGGATTFDYHPDSWEECRANFEFNWNRPLMKHFSMIEVYPLNNGV